jgi:cell division protein FtsL
MIKLLISLVCGLVLGALMLQLRQQRLELNHEVNLLHGRIEAQQARLWNQQLQIAIYTAPNAISKTVGSHALKMVPRSPLPAGPSHWMDVQGDPDTN